MLCRVGGWCAFLYVCSFTCSLAAPLPRAELHVRTLQHLTSYASPVGTPFSATVISPYLNDGEVVMPSGATLNGRVRRARSVGRGIFRGRASPWVEVYKYEVPDCRRVVTATRP